MNCAKYKNMNYTKTIYMNVDHRCKNIKSAKTTAKYKNAHTQTIYIVDQRCQLAV